MAVAYSTFRRIIDIMIGFALVFLLLFLGLEILVAYGQYEYPKHFQSSVPMTNMKDVERVFGTPVSVFTNPDGTVGWNYTHWWSGTAKVYFETNGNYFRTFTEF